LTAYQSGFIPRLAIRVLWCLTLQVPWCALGASLSGAMRSGSWNVAVGLAGLVAIALPAVFERTLIEEQSRKAEELLQRRRLAQADVLVARLRDLGSEQPLLGKPLAVLHRELAE